MAVSENKGPCRVTYIWLSGKDSHHDIRSKDRTLYFTAEEFKISPKDLLARGLFPAWNFDGSSTAQTTGLNTEIQLKPVNAFHCCLPRPSTKIPWFLVLAECLFLDGQETKDNSRAVARKIFDRHPEQRPWFGMEQEFFLMKEGRPYGWPTNGSPLPQGPYYCATGSHVIYGRKYIDLHYDICLEMGLKISGTNAEVAPGQWEFQVGPCEGIEMGDELIVARWVLLRILENDGLEVDYRAKPIRGDWNGSGLHTNFSTEDTRAAGGLDVIYKYIDRLKHTVAKDIVFYGSENNERLTGHHETSRYDEFSFGEGTRGTSIRIPNLVAKERKGYMEDRRPAGDADPYLVSARLYASCIGADTDELDLASPVYEKEWMRTSPEKPMNN